MKPKPILGLLAILLGAYEAWTLSNQASGDTISEVIWSLSDQWPVLTLLWGLLMGHFFWPRKR